MWFSEQNRCIGDDTKAVARRSKKCIRKAKNTYVEHGYLAHCRNSVKNCLLALKLTEIGQSAAEIWPKTIFKMAVVGHLDFFFKWDLWSCDCHRVLCLLLCTKLHQNRMLFRWDIAKSGFSRWRISAVMNFRGPIMGSLKSLCRNHFDGPPCSLPHRRRRISESVYHSLQHGRSQRREENRI